MNWLVGYFFKLLSFMISRLPVALRLKIGEAIGFLWFDVFQIRRQVALDNLAIAFPDLSLLERTSIARRSLESLGKTIVEYSLFPFITRRNMEMNFSFSGREHLDNALSEGRGVILLTLHIGNGDYAVSALSTLGYKANLISKEFKSRWLNDLWFGMRRKIGTRFISAEKSSFEILRALRRGEIVVFVLDQFMGPPIGVKTRFFGKETGTAAGCALIAGRTHAPVLPCYTYRRPDGRHVGVLEPAIQFLDDRPSGENIAVMTQVYTDKIEAIVRKCPEQWMWIHRRWKEFRE